MYRVLYQRRYVKLRLTSYWSHPNSLGHWRGAIPIPEAATLEEFEENLSGGNKEAFLQFIRKMVQWRPEDCQTANELLQDSWLTSD